jgi:hypothetical protein
LLQRFVRERDAAAFAALLQRYGPLVFGVCLRSFDYLDLAGKDEHINFREFWSIYRAPAEMTTTTTDAKGQFELNGMPQDVVCWLHVTHQRYAWLGLYAATTNKPLPDDIPLPSHFKEEPRPTVHTGDLDITLALPRQVVVRAVDADTGKPVRDLRINASSGMSTGSSAYGTSDAAGKVTLRLPPGEYHLQADPPRNSLDKTDSKWSMDYVRTIERLTVGKEQAQQKELRVRPGCVVLFTVVDADTGKGIRHVSITQRAEDGAGFNQVQTSTAYVGRAETNAEGKLRAVLYPGTGQFRIGTPPPGYEAVEGESGGIELPAGKAVTVRFTLRKKAPGGGADSR